MTKKHNLQLLVGKGIQYALTTALNQSFCIGKMAFLTTR